LCGTTGNEILSIVNSVKSSAHFGMTIILVNYQDITCRCHLKWWLMGNYPHMVFFRADELMYLFRIQILDDDDDDDNAYYCRFFLLY
jgi:hypothetical protein